MYAVTWIVNKELYTITTPNLDAAMDVWAAMHDAKMIVRLWGRKQELLM